MTLRRRKSPKCGRSWLVPLVALALLCLCLPPTLGRAQEGSGTELRIVDVDDSAFPTVRIVLEAETDDRPVASLVPGDLAVRETGSPATVTSIRKAVDASIPLALVIALDVSGSVSGDTLTRSQDAATLLVQSLAAPDSAALVSFSDQARLVQGLSTDKQSITDAIRALQASGNTALYDAVVLSATSASAADSGARRAVVLLSDGEDFGGISTAGRDGSLQRAAASGAVFYVIGVGAQVDQAYLQELAARTGGKYYSAPGASEIGGVYESLSELLRSQFVVEVESSADPAPRERNLTVSLVRDSVTTVSIDYTSRQPLPTPTPPPATNTPTPRPATPTPSPVAVHEDGEAGDGGAGIGWILGLSAGILLAGGGTAFAILRRRRPVAPAPLQPADTKAAPRPQGPVAVAAVARLITGDVAIDIGPAQGPFTAGASPECLLPIPAGPGVAPVHARLWWRDGRLMLHHVAPGFETRVNGAPVEWVSLAEGDEITIGQTPVRFTRPEDPGRSTPGAV